mmetsp:Transcript_10484/g.18336  ORF Transcript_10484/g.18336 Transcript_10484/m.18336 type:complete len:232 (+) Transcript_10484:616-1311(+)
MQRNAGRISCTHCVKKSRWKAQHSQLLSSCLVSRPSCSSSASSQRRRCRRKPRHTRSSATSTAPSTTCMMASHLASRTIVRSTARCWAALLSSKVAVLSPDSPPSSQSKWCASFTRSTHAARQRFCARSASRWSWTCMTCVPQSSRRLWMDHVQPTKRHRIWPLKPPRSSKTVPRQQQRLQQQAPVLCHPAAARLAWRWTQPNPQRQQAVHLAVPLWTQTPLWLQGLAAAT